MRVAHHEAGHAAIAVALGTGVRVASIEPDKAEGTLGHVAERDLDAASRPDVDDEYAVRKALEPRIISALAGVIAERRYSSGRHNWAGARSDLAAVDDMVLRCVGGDPHLRRHYLRWLQRRAELQVDRWWPSIQGVATALNERTVLDEEAIRRASRTGAGLRDDRASWRVTDTHT